MIVDWPQRDAALRPLFPPHPNPDHQLLLIQASASSSSSSHANIGPPTRFLFLLFFFPPSIQHMMPPTIENASPAMRPSSLPSPPNHNRIWELRSPSILMTLVGRITNFDHPSHRHLVVVSANVSTALDRGGSVSSLGGHRSFSPKIQVAD